MVYQKISIQVLRVSTSEGHNETQEVFRVHSLELLSCFERVEGAILVPREGFIMCNSVPAQGLFIDGSPFIVLQRTSADIAPV